MNTNRTIHVDTQELADTRELEQWIQQNSVESGAQERFLRQYYGDEFLYQSPVFKRPHTLLTKPEWQVVQPVNDQIGTSVQTKTVHHEFQAIRQQLIRKLAFESDRFEDTKVQVNNFMRNGDVFRPVSITTTDGGIEIDFEMTDYYSTLTNGGTLRYELYNQAMEENGFNAVQSLSYRDKYMPTARDALTVSNRHTELGVFVAVILNHGNNLLIPTAYRTGRVNAERYRYSLIPTLGYDPIQKGTSSIRDVIVKEFCEELLSDNELRYFDKIRTAIQDDKIQLRNTGVGVNAMSGAVHSANLLYIEDRQLSEWVLENRSDNWEMTNSESILLPLSEKPTRFRPSHVSSGSGYTFFRALKTLEHRFSVQTGLRQYVS